MRTWGVRAFFFGHFRCHGIARTPQVRIDNHGYVGQYTHASAVCALTICNDMVGSKNPEFQIKYYDSVRPVYTKNGPTASQNFDLR